MIFYLCLAGGFHRFFLTYTQRVWDYCDAQGLTSHGQLGFGVGVMCGKSEVGGWGGGECQSEWTGGKKGKIPWMWCPKVVRLHHYRGHLTLSIVSLINRRAEVVESIIRRPPGLSLPYFSFIHRWMLPASCCCCKSWSSLGGCQ